MFKIQRAEVAQSVEQGTENPRVGSSILSLGTIEIKGLAILVRPFFIGIHQNNAHVSGKYCLR